MHKKISATLAKLRRLEQERLQKLQLLLDDRPLVRGSLSLIKRTCGSPGCHCAKAPSHEVWVLATGHGPGGARRCQVVRQADVEHVAGRVQVHRESRQALRDLDAIQKEQKALLRGLMEMRDEPYE